MMPILNRSSLNFESNVRKIFSFLDDLGFSIAEVSPTHILYQKGDFEVDIYHGRQSYEIAAGIFGHGVRYAMSEIIRVTNPAVAERYRSFVATTPESVITALEELAALMKEYGVKALCGDSQFFSELEHQRKTWSEAYSLDVLAKQLRPKADNAFRRGDYAVAAELYARIRPRLSPTEIKKLTIAEERTEAQ